MFSGFYTIASGMMNNQKELNVAANNLANVRTNGYRSKRLIKGTFDETFVRHERSEHSHRRRFYHQSGSWGKKQS